MRQILLGLLLWLSFSSNAQLDTNLYRNNGVFIETFGAGGWWSVNYERKLFVKAKIAFSLRAGVGTLNIRDFRGVINPDITIPTTVFFATGRKHGVEFGVGNTITNVVKQLNSSDKSRELRYHFHGSVGYRYERKSGFLFKINYVPIIDSYNSYQSWFGAAIGYTF